MNGPSLLRRALEPFMPPVRAIRGYRRADLPHDVVAGLTASVVDLPQSMAFAVIAGVPPVYGIYTAIVLGFFGALFSSSRFLAVGPTNTQSLLIAAIVTRLTDDPAVYLRLVIALGLIKGVIQLAFAAARLGRLVRYVSGSVMIGFTAGAGLLIFLEQLPSFLGEGEPMHISRLPAALGRAHDVIASLGAAQGSAIAIGVGALAVLLIAQRLRPWVPGPLLAVAGGAFVVRVFHLDVPTIGWLPRDLPALSLPGVSLGELEALFAGALALALLGMLESVAIAKSIARRTGQSISPDQEFFGQGVANLAGSLLQCMPGSGSFSRTALQYAVGARSRFASVARALFNLTFFLLLAPLARHIPLAVLAAILFHVAFSLIDVRTIGRIVRTSRGDAAVCLATLASTLVLPLAYAIYAGIFLNLVLYLRQATQLRLARLVEAGPVFSETPVVRIAPDEQGVYMLQLDGDLFFGIEDELATRLREIGSSKVEVAVFRLKRTHFIDSNVLLAFEQFVDNMHQQQRHVVFCGVRPSVLRQMRSIGLYDQVGEDNIFAARRGAFSGARVAMTRARALAHQPHADYQI
ncbi:MAG TPA: SulP family inorganic anion transporter [Kofleriaceae bacterium]|nr:SulP family inorganic anion transporter [Kofleriaceae bacterium]